MFSLVANQLFRSEMEIKKSRFICSLKRCESEAEARDFIAEIRNEYNDARHNCTAFKISNQGSSDICRSSDDGEPAGTAGMPMLEALGEISNITAVVSRYFGGIKLGTGGLVRAYAGAVKNGLAAAQKVEIKAYPSYFLNLPITEASKIEGVLLANQYHILERQWGEMARLQLLKPETTQLNMETELSTWLSTAVTLQQAEVKIVELPL